MFPTFYRNQADELMKKHFPQGYTIEREEAVPIGTVTTVHTDTDALHFGPFLVDQTSKSTTTTQPWTEWHITYRPK
jgi:hypothetical protein